MKNDKNATVNYFDVITVKQPLLIDEFIHCFAR